jgi:sugar phosphate isomerase/epimerase
MLKLSVFTVMLPDLTPDEAAPLLKESGYDGVEWRVTQVPAERQREAPSFWGNNLCTFGPTLAEAERAKAVSDSAGLVIAGLGTYINVGDLAATENAMRMARTCGAEKVRISPGSWPGDLSYHDSFKRAQTFLDGAQALAQQYGVKAVVEIHHRTITPSASLAYRLVSDFDPDWIGVIHDAGNMVYEGFEDYRLGIELLGPFLAHVHIKNACYARPPEGGVWRSEWSPLEDGVVDWEALFTALRDTGYDGWLGLEDFSQARPTRDALRYNIAFLRDAIDQVYGGGL